MARDNDFNNQGPQGGDRRMIESEFVNGWQSVHQCRENSTQDLKEMTFQMYVMKNNPKYID